MVMKSPYNCSHSDMVVLVASSPPISGRPKSLADIQTPTPSPWHEKKTLIEISKGPRKTSAPATQPSLIKANLPRPDAGDSALASPPHLCSGAA
jgi:hypothetical protein